MNNINFTARLNIREMPREEKTRFENVKKIFEEKTKNYPNDEVYVWGDKDSFYFGVETNGMDYDYETYEVECLMANSDKTIANKLAKLIRILNRREQTIESANKFLDKLADKDKYHTVTDKFCSRVMEPIYDKADLDVRRALNSDSVLEDFEEA